MKQANATVAGLSNRYVALEYPQLSSSLQ